MKEKELANGIYIMLNQEIHNYNKIMQIETIGKLMLEAKEHNITKTLLHLLDLYLKDIAKENQEQIRSNRGVIYEAEKDRHC